MVEFRPWGRHVFERIVDDNKPLPALKPALEPVHDTVNVDILPTMLRTMGIAQDTAIDGQSWQVKYR